MILSNILGLQCKHAMHRLGLIFIKGIEQLIASPSCDNYKYLSDWLPD